jgi:hypothetical protein
MPGPRACSTGLGRATGGSRAQDVLDEVGDEALVHRAAGHDHAIDAGVEFPVDDAVEISCRTAERSPA